LISKEYRWKFISGKNKLMERGIRIDKWLWAVRIFKTRSLASDACRSGKVKIHDQAVKPSREIKIDEVVTISLPPITKTVKVISVIGNRVSAKLVPGIMEDLTPEAEYQKLKRLNDTNFEFRERGIGRPTKRERREIEYLKLYLDE
jgi:ribosome-associated heat shock protein Hsp15